MSPQRALYATHSCGVLEPCMGEVENILVGFMEQAQGQGMRVLRPWTVKLLYIAIYDMCGPIDAMVADSLVARALMFQRDGVYYQARRWATAYRYAAIRWGFLERGEALRLGPVGRAMRSVLHVFYAPRGVEACMR